ncbi:MAG: hypothetical protein M3511_00220 [Deinococcota bacterium]|nr:hypothetical protein [Deinococcota bacterium]
MLALIKDGRLERFHHGAVEIVKRFDVEQQARALVNHYQRLRERKTRRLTASPGP